MSVTFGLPISVRFLSDPCFISKIPCFLRRYISSVFHCAGNIHGRVPVYSLWSVAKDSVCAMSEQEGGGQGHAGGKKKCVGVREKLFWRAIYCVKTRLDTGYQSGSRSCRGLGRRAPRIMR